MGGNGQNINICPFVRVFAHTFSGIYRPKNFKTVRMGMGINEATRPSKKGLI